MDRYTFDTRKNVRWEVILTTFKYNPVKFYIFTFKVVTVFDFFDKKCYLTKDEKSISEVT